MDVGAKSIRDWVERQIEMHGPASGSAPDATRLAEAAAALQPGSTMQQIFGLQVPAGGVPDAAELFRRCLVLLSAWERALSADGVRDLHALMRRLGLPGAERSTAPRAVEAVLEVFVPAVVENLDTGEETTDLEVLGSVQGAREQSGDSLIDIPCVRTATGGSFGTVGARPDFGWAVGSNVDLVLDPRSRRLRCRLSFDLSTVPDDDSIARLRHVIENELFYTGWGLNMGWDRAPGDDALAVCVASNVVEHRVVRRP